MSDKQTYALKVNGQPRQVTAAELEKWKEKVESIARRAESTYVIANTHFQAKAAVNALELRHLLDGKKVRAPETLVKHYP